MEQHDNDTSLFGLSIDETTKDHLRKICSWTMIIVVAAVISYIVAIIKAFMPKAQAIQGEGFGVSVSTGQNLGSAIFGIIIGLLINYFLYQFATLTKKGVNGMSQTDLNAGFYNLKIYFVIISIIVIIVLAIVLLAFLAIGAGASVVK
jgi:small-conductance mechanosensitive channel